MKRMLFPRQDDEHLPSRQLKVLTDKTESGVLLSSQPSAVDEKLNYSEKEETLGRNRRGKKYHVEEGN